MKQPDQQQQEALLTELDDAVRAAVAYFQTAPEALFDGYMTAREVVSHLTFWHEMYVQTARALVNGRQPKLLRGSFACLNAQAAAQLQSVPFDTLLRRLCSAQQQFHDLLLRLPDWQRPFPIKKGDRDTSVYDRLVQIRTHIRRHADRMERAERHGEEWVRAYFLES